MIKIYSHRGNVDGKNSIIENSVPALLDAILNDFAVEFDINFTIDHKQIILTHDEQIYSPNHDVLSFFTNVNSNRLHALNIKNLITLQSIINLIENYKLQDNLKQLKKVTPTIITLSVQYTQNPVTRKGH